jgi:tRNA A37 threonylcarbamoyladenosine biosynthesis protein TsaE
MQFEAGLPEYARETLEAAHMDAYQQGDDATADQIQAILDQMAGS